MSAAWRGSENGLFLPSSASSDFFLFSTVISCTSNQVYSATRTASFVDLKPKALFSLKIAQIDVTVGFRLLFLFSFFRDPQHIHASHSIFPRVSLPGTPRLAVVPGRAGVSIADEVIFLMILVFSVVARQTGHHSPCRMNFSISRRRGSQRTNILYCSRAILCFHAILYFHAIIVSMAT